MRDSSLKALAYVPDRIVSQLKKTNDQSLQRIERLYGAVLYFDMVGFTTLTEEFIEKSHSADLGAEKLREVLTEYYNEMLTAVRKYGGFTYQFAGDSVLIGMVRETDEDSRMCAARAAICALEARENVKKLNSRKTNPDDIQIEIKISISIGDYYQIVLGTPDQLINSTLIGDPVDEAVAGESVAGSGDVIVTNSIWEKLPREKNGTGIDSNTDLHTEKYYKLISLDLNNCPVFEGSTYETGQLDERTLKICSRFVPEILYHKIVESHGDYIGDFRDVTSLFIGFAQEAARDVKERVGIANRFFEFLHQTSVAYGGNLVQTDFTDKGNVFLILFGAPQGLENKEIMAARFALKVQSEKANFREIYDIRIGIASGRSYCGGLGSVFRKGYTVVSRSVNLAARLMTYNLENRGGMTIFMDSTTHNCLTSDFETKFVESENLKGIKDTVSFYRLLRENTSNRNLLESWAQPLVGRQKDLENLSHCLEKVVDSGSLKLASVTGEAGIGKSRLMGAFLQSIEKNNYEIYTSTCYPYERFSPFYLWKNVIAEILKIHEMNSEPLKIEQIESVLNSLDNVDIQWARTLGRFIGINTEENVLTKNLEINQKKERVFQIIANLVQTKSKVQPVILVFEDVHWIDDASYELFEYILQNLVNYPVMVLLGYRSWDGLSKLSAKFDLENMHTLIGLTDLDEPDAIKLIRQKLNLASENTDLEKLVFSNSRGNPFFIESIVHNLIENDILKNGPGGNILTAENIRDIIIPRELNDVILARIDRLSEKEQLILKTASVIGRVFYFNLLQRLFQNLGKSILTSHLDTLERLDLTPRESENPLSYAFKHIVIRDIAYNSMLTSTRRNIHLQLANILEEENTAKPEKIAGTLSYHFKEGENFSKACYYSQMAARWAAEQFSNLDAIHYYEESLKILYENQDIHNQQELVFQIKEELAGVCRNAGEFERSRYLYAECFDFYTTPVRMAKLYIGMGQIFQEQANDAKAIRYMEKALQLLGANAPNYKISIIAALLGQVFLRILHHLFPFFIRRIKKNNEIFLLRTHVFMILGKIYYFKSLESVAWSAFALINLAERTGSKYDLCLAYSNYATILEGLGLRKGAVKYFERSMEIVKTSNFQYAEGLILQRYGLHGLYQNDPKFTISCEQKSIYIFRQIGELWEVLTSLILSVIGRIITGDLYEALNELKEMKNISIKVNSKMQLGWALSQITHLEYILGIKQYHEIKNDLEEAIRLAKETGDLSGRSMTCAFEARILTFEGAHGQALEFAEKACNEIINYKIKLPHIIYGLVYVCEAGLEALNKDSIAFKKRALKLYMRSLRFLKLSSRQFEYLHAPTLRIKALLHWHLGRRQLARNEISQALQILKDSANVIEYAQTLVNAGRILEDENYTREGIRIFHECGIKKYY